MFKMSLKNIIENFLLHVEKLDLKLSENEDLYEKEFQNLKILTDQVRATPQYICSAGEIPENKKKNRYKDILPYDFNRVTLHDDPDVPGSDYINASYIKGASGSIAYIAAQAPLPNTVDDFWRMAWESEVLTIIMVCNEFEAGRPKCERYWPNKNEVKQFGKIMVKMVDMQEMGTDYRVRQLSVTFGDMTRTIHHFHYHTWPDHGTPLSVKAIIEMVSLVRKFQASETVPILVHCSAGCGRTGTVCAIDYVGGLLRNGKLTEEFNIKHMVFDMRKQRIAMVQTAEQYIVVHRAVQELFEDHLKVIDSHPYANIDFTGQPYLHKLNKKYDEVQYENFQQQKAVVVDSEGPVIITVSNEKAPDAGSSQPPPLPKKTKFEQQNKVERDNFSKHSIEYLETNSDNTSNKSRMDYVKDWCDGILTTKTDLNEGTHSEQVEASPQQVFATKLSTPGQSPNQSPSLKRCSTSEIVNGKHGLGSKPNFSNLVRKPSMAKFRALFDNGSNSGSSGTSSPENWLSRSSSRAKSIVSKKSNDDDSAGMEKLNVKTPTRSKSKANESEYLKDKICSNIINRYDDTAHRIFKENRNLHSDNFDNFDYSISGATPSPSSRSGNGDDFSLSDSPSPRIFRHRSYLSVSHSPLPTSNSDSVMKDLVTRVVGSRRNSFAEKRSSTWYDNTSSFHELGSPEEKNDLNPLSNNYKKAQNTKGISKKLKNSSTSVKRSISMKVGFRSPIFSRRKNINENVAPYLAIEESSKKFDQVPSEQINAKKSSASSYCKGNLEEEKSIALNTNIKYSSSEGVNNKIEDDVLRNIKSKNIISNERSSCRTMPVPSPRLSRVQQKDALVLSGPDKRTIIAENIDEKCIAHNENEKLANLKCHDDRRRMDVERINLVRGADNSPGSADDSYGAEMDEYCQKIILDCQKYLVARQTGGLHSQVEIDQLPNHDSSNSAANHVEKFKNHDYERLWFSRSASKSENNAKSAFYVDDPGDKMYANHSFHQHTLEKKAREARNSDNLTDENAILRHDMENLRYNFNKIITDAVDRGQRKPLPAPRTILQSTKSTGSESPNKNIGRPHDDDATSHSSSFNNSFSESPELTSYSAAGQRSFHEYENTLVRDGSCHLESESFTLTQDYEASNAPFDERERLANIVAENLTIDGGMHSASTPLYRSVHKCKSRADDSNSLQKIGFENNEQFVILRTKNREGYSPRHNMSKSLASVKPVAPPRMRRKPSISSSKSLHTADCRPVSLELDRQYFYDVCDDQPQSNSPDLYNVVDSPDEIPPVPVKTKDAYRLPQEELSVNDLSSIETLTVSSGLPFSKTLNKLQTNIFLKFAHSNDDKDNDSAKSGLYPRKTSQRSVIVPGFSNRLEIKPKGPRDPPQHWKLSSCTL